MSHKRYCGPCDAWVPERECPACGADTDAAEKLATAARPAAPPRASAAIGRRYVLTDRQVEICRLALSVLLTQRGAIHFQGEILQDRVGEIGEVALVLSLPKTRTAGTGGDRG